jgi:two-component system response regulator YesN
MIYFANAGDTYCTKEEMNRLLSFTDTRQLFVMMKQSVRTVCALMKESESTTANKLGKKLLDYVDANYTKPELCLTSAADYMGTSIYVVSRLFKDVTGKGFKEFVTDKRLEHARALLEDTNENVSAVSVLSGFENPVYFSNLFKAKYGLAPTQYRKMRKTE